MSSLSGRRLLYVCLQSVSLRSAAARPAQDPTRVGPTHDTMRPEILALHGIVAGGRHYWVAAGVRMLEQGGNAIDAGVATVFAAWVVEISHFGFGGESPVMIHDAKTREVIVINGQGPAPRAATLDVFSAKGRVDGNGPLGATIPAMLGAMAAGARDQGRDAPRAGDAAGEDGDIARRRRPETRALHLRMVITTIDAAVAERAEKEH